MKKWGGGISLQLSFILFLYNKFLKATYYHKSNLLYFVNVKLILRANSFISAALPKIEVINKISDILSSSTIFILKFTVRKNCFKILLNRYHRSLIVTPIKRKSKCSLIFIKCLMGPDLH